MDDKRPPDNWTDDFKAEVAAATDRIAAQIAWLKENIPGGPRKRKRYRTKGHGARKVERRRRNKVARASRQKARPHKKRRKT